MGFDMTMKNCHLNTEDTVSANDNREDVSKEVATKNPKREDV
jgi:hypothetical protein